MRMIDGDALIEALLEARHEETETALKLVRFIRKQPTIEPNISGKMIDADAFAEAIDKLQWYSLHCNGEMMRGAVCEEDAYYKATDIYTEINKAVTIRADVIEPKRGRWIITDEHLPLKETCDQCGFTQFQSRIKNYCPNCGARMEASDD